VARGPILIGKGGADNLPSMDIDGSLAWIGDVHQNPGPSELAAGFFRMEPSESFIYDYTYDEMKLVIEGDLVLTDVATGQVVEAGPLDVLHFPKGTQVRFDTRGGALAFYTGHRSFSP
jgi:ethanolamine utilization protein EutQ (cupin superfamily)